MLAEPDVEAVDRRDLEAVVVAVDGLQDAPMSAADVQQVVRDSLGRGEEASAVADSLVARSLAEWEQHSAERDEDEEVDNVTALAILFWGGRGKRGRRGRRRR